MNGIIMQLWILACAVCRKEEDMDIVEMERLGRQVRYRLDVRAVLERNIHTHAP